MMIETRGTERSKRSASSFWVIVGSAMITSIMALWGVVNPFEAIAGEVITLGVAFGLGNALVFGMV